MSNTRTTATASTSSSSTSQSSNNAPTATATSCGDEAIDRLVANGTIAKLKTCCGTHVYGDHNLYITMANGTEIISNSTGSSFQLQITVNGTAYLKDKTDVSSLLGILSMFTKQNFAYTPKPFSFSKRKVTTVISEQPAHETIDEAESQQQSNESEFDAVFNTLPEEVRNVLNTRLKPKAVQISVINRPDGSGFVPFAQI